MFPSEQVPWPVLNPDANLYKAWLLAEGPDRRAMGNRKLVTLTFDDGPFHETAPTTLRLLSEHRVRGTFFLIGKYLEGDSRRAVLARSTAKQIAEEGHLIGNHTRDHRLLGTSHKNRTLEQIDEGARLIREATGKMPLFFRPPYGWLDPFGERVLKERGMEPVMWSVAADDMERSDAEGIFDDLKTRLEYAGGGIVLLHDMHWPSVKALGRFLEWLARHRYDAQHPETPGYDIVDLPTYLWETARNPQPFASREELESVRQGEWLLAHPGQKLKHAQSAVRTDDIL